MMTVNEVAKLADVSVRTLQYYDKMGLLNPTRRTDSGYRLYGVDALERLQQILLFRELEFPLKDIKRIVDAPQFDKKRALDQQIELLELKRDHLSGLIDLARKLKEDGGSIMDFEAFDTKKIDEYTARAKAEWGDTPQYKEFESKNKNRTADDQQAINAQMMGLFVEFGTMKQDGADSAAVQAQVVKLQSFISEHFYLCTDEILSGLGKMYASGGEFTQNIDAAAGEGTAEFVARAIEAHCASAN